jgi:hypothetical protein
MPEDSLVHNKATFKKTVPITYQDFLDVLTNLSFAALYIHSNDYNRTQNDELALYNYIKPLFQRIAIYQIVDNSIIHNVHFLYLSCEASIEGMLYIKHPEWISKICFNAICTSTKYIFLDDVPYIDNSSNLVC